MSTDIKLKITDVQRFCMHDGPGIRTTVFLKGCPLRCAWCHNPETQRYASELLFYQNKCIFCGECIRSCQNAAHVVNEQHFIDRTKCISCGECASRCPASALEICGGLMSVDEVLTVIEKDAAFYGQNGGITISGGEPFMQGEGVLCLLRACKQRGINTAVETCGYADISVLRAAVPYTDLFLWDLKDTDDIRHKQYTGVSNQRILQNLSLINELNARIRLRCIMVNGINTDESHYHAIADIAKTIHDLDGVELIPYHAYAGTKAVFLGHDDNGRKDWIPTEQHILQAKRLLHKMNVKSL